MLRIKFFISASSFLVITLDILIFPSVNVNVLSQQITEVDPNVSTDESRRIRPFRFRIRSIPIAKITVIVIGIASGIPPTAIAIAASNISTTSPPLRIPPTKIAVHRTKNNLASKLPNLPILRCSGVCSSSVSSRICEIFPVSVITPVPVTTNLPCPDSTRVPA